MSKNNNIGGIFYPLLRHISSRLDLERKSRTWKVLFTISIAVVALFVVGLFIMAARSYTGIGVPVVVTTMIAAVIILLAVAVQPYLRTRLSFSRSRCIMITIAIVALLVVSLLIVAQLMASTPALVNMIRIALVGGSLSLGALLLLFFYGYPRLRERGIPGQLTMTGFLLVISIVYMTAVSRFIVPYDPFKLDVGGILQPPSPQFPLGTTALGQDMLSRVIAGGAVMLQVAALSVLVCFCIGVPLGLAASYRGGLTDRLTSLVMDSIFALPGLVLAIAVAAILGPGVVNMALAIAVVYIPSYFRIVRSQVLTVKELPYVESAIVLGARTSDILFRYMLPNILPSIVVVMSINFADAVLTAAGLTYVGLGLTIDVTDWGRDLYDGAQRLVIERAWWIITFPGIMIILLALGFTLIGEGLNEILTPRLKE